MFSKHAAESLFPDVEREEEEIAKKERSRDILYLALASGALLGGIGLMYANREHLANLLGDASIIDTRDSVSRTFEDGIGMSPAAVGGGVGVLSTVGPTRRNRLLFGDMARQNHIAGLGRHLTGTAQDPHTSNVRSAVTTDPKAAQGLGRLITQSAGADGDTRGVFSRLAASDPYSERGEVLRDPDSGKARDFLRGLVRPGEASGQADTIIRNLSRVDADADSGRAALSSGAELTPQQRSGLSLEAELLRAQGHKTTKGSDFFDRTPPQRVSELGTRLGQARTVKPPFSAGRLVGRTALGAFAGQGVAAGTSWALGN